jgi:hypothetical protein
MVTSWEQFKNKRKHGYSATTSYHSIEEANEPPYKKRKAVMLDTGANITLLDNTAEPMLSNTKDSRIKIEIADKRFMHGGKDGTAHMHILQISQQTHELSERKPTLRSRNKTPLNLKETGIVLSHKVTTVDNLSRELFSVDEMFTNGCSILLRAPEYENGIPEIHIPATQNSPAMSIPMRYDYEEGGFWLDYYLHDPRDDPGANAKAAEDSWRDQTTTTAMIKSMPWYGQEQAAQITCELEQCDAISQVHFVHEMAEFGEEARAHAANDSGFDQHPEASITNIRGVKMGLTTNKRQLRADEFHEDHGHLGCI